MAISNKYYDNNSVLHNSKRRYYLIQIHHVEFILRFTRRALTAPDLRLDPYEHPM